MSLYIPILVVGGVLILGGVFSGVMEKSGNSTWMKHIDTVAWIIAMLYIWKMITELFNSISAIYYSF